MTLSFYLLFLAIFLVPTIGIMWSGIKDRPGKLFIKGLVLLLYIGTVSYGMLDDGESINSPMLKYAGNIILLVVSILSSVMISCAWSELRSKHNREQ